MFDLKELKFIKKIGSGAFGKVYLVSLNKETKVQFAIKILKWRKILNMRQADQLDNELLTLKSLIGSPFITRLISTSNDKRVLGIVMEYLSGGELFYWLRKFGKFSEYATIFYACEILAGLNFIHRKGFLYRDLKPENILLTSSGHIKLTDFGFSVKGFEKTYIISGTPEYMSPEKLLNEDDGIESDYWSFGVILYEMLVGDPPFFDKNTNAIYKKILGENVTFPKNMSYTCKDIVNRLLRKYRQERLGFFGIEEIMGHPFFSNVNWDDVTNLNTNPPINPNLYSSLEFENLSDNEDSDDNLPEIVQKPYDYVKIFK